MMVMLILMVIMMLILMITIIYLNIRFDLCGTCEGLSLQPYPMIKMHVVSADIDHRNDDGGSGDGTTHWAYKMFCGYIDYPLQCHDGDDATMMLIHEHVMCDVCQTKPIVGIR